MPLVIRKANMMDLEDIYQIEIECFAFESFSKQQLEYSLKSPDFLSLIAILDRKPVGFIIGSIEIFRGEVAGHVCSIDVRPGYRRRGIGSSLLEALERIFADKGIETCYLEVRVDNTSARRLYLKHGYEPSEKIKDYYGIGIDGVRLKKILK